MPSFPFHFYHLVPVGFLRSRSKLKRFLLGIFKSNGKKIKSVNYIFCSDDYLLAINRGYLQKDDFTDTISFTLSGRGEAIVGEVYISIDRVRENAKVFNVSASKELHRVIFHSTLHLCGYEDNPKALKEKMKRLEDGLLSSYLKQ